MSLEKVTHAIQLLKTKYQGIITKDLLNYKNLSELSDSIMRDTGAKSCAEIVLVSTAMEIWLGVHDRMHKTRVDQCRGVESILGVKMTNTQREAKSIALDTDLMIRRYAKDAVEEAISSEESATRVISKLKDITEVTSKDNIYVRSTLASITEAENKNPDLAEDASEHFRMMKGLDGVFKTDPANNG